MLRCVNNKPLPETVWTMCYEAIMHILAKISLMSTSTYTLHCVLLPISTAWHLRIYIFSFFAGWGWGWGWDGGAVYFWTYIGGYKCQLYLLPCLSVLKKGYLYTLVIHYKSWVFLHHTFICLRVVCRIFSICGVCSFFVTTNICFTCVLLSDQLMELDHHSDQSPDFLLVYIGYREFINWQFQAIESMAYWLIKGGNITIQTLSYNKMSMVICRHRLRYWRHFLNQCWPSFLTHTYVNWPRWGEW